MTDIDENLNESQSIDTLIDHLDGDERDVEVAIVRLVLVGQPAVKPLIAALRDQKKWYNAAEALGRLGVVAMPSLIKAGEDDSIDSFVFHAIQRIGVPATPYLLETLRGENRELRAWAALGLDVGSDDVIDPLVNALRSDKAYSVRLAATQTLSRIGDRRIIDALSSAAETDNDARVRQAATDAIKAIDNKFPRRTDYQN